VIEVADGHATVGFGSVRPTSAMPDSIVWVEPDFVAVPANFGMFALSHAAFGISGNTFLLPANAVV